MPRVPRRCRWLIAAGPLALLLLGLAPGAAPAQALTLPPPTGVLHTTYGPPSIARLGTLSGIVAGDNHGNIDTWFQEGTQGWLLARVATASGGVFYSSPAMASNGGEPLIAAVSSAGGLDYWYQAPGATAWTREQVATGGYSSPAITVGNGLVMITAIDSAGNADVWSQALGSTAWSPAQVISSGQPGPFAAPSIAWAGPYTVITATGRGQVWSWLQWDGSTFWTPELVPASTAGRDFGYDAPAMTVTSSQVEIAAAVSGGGPSQVIDLWSLPIGQAGWGAPQPVSTDSGPSLGWTGSDLVMVSQDPEDDLWLADQSGGWAPAAITSGVGHSYNAPQVAAMNAGELAVVAADQGSIYSWIKPPGATAWTPVLVAAATG
jgi:hypothetical protein